MQPDTPHDATLPYQPRPSAMTTTTTTSTAAVAHGDGGGRHGGNSMDDDEGPPLVINDGNLHRPLQQLQSTSSSTTPPQLTATIPRHALSAVDVISPTIMITTPHLHPPREGEGSVGGGANSWNDGDDNEDESSSSEDLPLRHAGDDAPPIAMMKATYHHPTIDPLVELFCRCADGTANELRKTAAGSDEEEADAALQSFKDLFSASQTDSLLFASFVLHLAAGTANRTRSQTPPSSLLTTTFTSSESPVDFSNYLLMKWCGTYARGARRWHGRPAAADSGMIVGKSTGTVGVGQK